MRWASGSISRRAKDRGSSARPRDEASIAALEVPDMAKLRYVFDAVREIKRALTGRVPLIGFAGSPFTLACYMIEGAGSRRLRHGAPHGAWPARPPAPPCRRSTRARWPPISTSRSKPGVDAVMLFDTWGGLLTTDAYHAFSLDSMRSVLAALRRRTGRRPVPDDRVHERRRAMARFDRGCGAACVGLDWTVDLAAARRRVGDRVALQGNLDPLVLLADRARVAREATAIVRAAGPAPGHIFNLGHGIVPATPPDHVALLVETVQRESRAMRAET